MERIETCDILLVNPPYHRRRDSGLTIPLGLAYLASYLQSKRFRTLVFDSTLTFDSLDNESLKQLEIWLSQNLNRFRPKLAIGIGPVTLCSVPSTIIVEKVCRRLFPETPIVYGGPMASTPGLEWFFFEYLHANAVIPGDAEIALANFLQSLNSNEKSHVEGVFYSSQEKFIPNVIQNLDELPFPARELFQQNAYFLSARRDLFESPFATIMCSRGCIFNCGFCSSSTIRKGIQTKRSLGNIAIELEMLVNNAGVKSIVFFDDTYFSNGKEVNEDVQEFSRMIRSVSENIVWQIEMRPDVACFLEERTINELFESGCRQINLGIEKGTTRGLKSIGKRLDVQDSIEACTRIRKAAPKLRLAGTFILGGPGETYEEAIQTIDFSTTLGLIFAHFSPLEVYPGTELYREKFGDDMKVWLEKVLEEQTFVGSIIYEDLPDRNDLIDLLCRGYKGFYRRKEWENLAKTLLGDNYQRVKAIAFQWGEALRW